MSFVQNNPREPVNDYCVYSLRACLCGLTICRSKSLLEESVHSYLPAFFCGTEVLLMCLPLRLDTGNRPNHLHQRYAFCQMEENTHHSGWWKRKLGQMQLISWCTHKVFILALIIVVKDQTGYWGNYSFCIFICSASECLEEEKSLKTLNSYYWSI